MIDKVGGYIKEHALLPDGGAVTVALSGGADSVCLARCLVLLGYRVEAAHCNFHLRGSESDRDERFVRALCDRLGIVLHVRHFDTRAEVERTGKSVEMAARDLRYGWFSTFASPVAVAHHKDDNAETFLLNLVRGSGLSGLTGMSPKRATDGSNFIVRPLLCVTRQEIICFLHDNPLDGMSLLFVNDSTNDSDEARRNIVRHHVVPLLRELNPSIVDTLNATIARLNEAKQVYAEAMTRHIAVCFDGGAIDKRALMLTPAPMAVLHEILAPLGFNAGQIGAILRDGVPGKVYESRDWRLLRDRTHWLLRDKRVVYELLTDVLPLEGEVWVTHDVRFVITRHQAAGFVIPRDKDTVCMDMENLTLPLTLRLVRGGDRFVPYGMTSSKLVSDYLTDCHKTLFDKERQMVVLSGDEIVWVVGERPSAGHRVTAQSRCILQITRQKEASHQKKS